MFEEGDVVVVFSTIYPACEKTLASIGEMIKGGLRVEKADLVYPIEDDEIVRKLREKIMGLQGEGKRVRLAMCDTVLTFPGARFPWERCVEVCKELGVLSLVDGAHGIGKFHNADHWICGLPLESTRVSFLWMLVERFANKI